MVRLLKSNFSRVFYGLAFVCGISLSQISLANQLPNFQIRKLVENRGQIKTQTGEVNNQVLFQYYDNDWNVSICDSGFRYQYNRYNKQTQKFDAHRMHQTFSFYQQLSKTATEKFYNGNDELIGLRFKEVYPNINLLVQIDGGFKYSFEVKKSANIANIQWQYFGVDQDITQYPSNAVQLLVGGNKFKDDFPRVFFMNSDGSESDVSHPKFVKEKGFVRIRFDEKMDISKGQTLVIDPRPTLNYSTYFGGTDVESTLFNTTDDSSNTYIAGYTSSASSISTTGTYKSTFGGNIDGFVAKFSSSQVLLWATYFGGGSEDKISKIVYSSKANSLFVVGHTQSNTNISTSGVHQTNYAGGTDAFLAKFTKHGKLTWCTYFGGTANDRFTAVDFTDTTIVAVGLTESNANIATSGALQTTYAGSMDGVIAEFYQNGKLKQATYYGGSNQDVLISVDLSSYPTFLVAGNTSSSGLGTGFTHSPTINGQIDGFVAQFEDFKTLDWCTYFGGNRDDEIYHLSLSPFGEVVISGGTLSSSGITTSGSFKSSYGGSEDGFLAFLDAYDGTLNYSTYFGGAGLDRIISHHVDYRGNVALLGVTQSSADIATVGALNTTYNGNFEGFIAKFNKKNKLWWSSYLGESQDDYFRDLNYNFRNNYIASGHSASSSLATTGAYQTTNNGNDDGLFMWLTDCPTNITFSVSKKDVKCYGEKTGEIKITMSDLTRDFMYGINPRQLGSSSTITNLAAGNYRIYAVDSGGCIWFDSVKLVQPNEIIITPTVKKPTCFGGNDGQISLSVTGGITPYSYFWNTSPSQTTSSITNLISGKYTVTVQDGNGCSVNNTVTIEDPVSISLSASINDVGCNGANTGSVTLTATGGSGTYLYSLGGVTYQVSNVFSSLTAGVKTFYVKDGNGCIKSEAFTINEPTVLVLNTVGVVDALCKGSATGSISVSGSGGVPAYQFKIGAGSYGSSGTFTGLSANNYLITIQDANGCTQSNIISVKEPTSAINVSSSITDAKCNGTSTGSVTITATGGTAPYEYKLGTGTFQNSNSFTGLSAGTYTVTVRDFNKCTQDITVIISEPAALVLSVSSNTPVTCFGTSTGIVDLSATGGTPTYEYQMDGGSFQNSTTFSGLAAKSYSFTVKDNKGCTSSLTATVTQPTLLSVTATGVTHVDCKGFNTGSITLTATGGTAGYSYGLNGGSFQASSTFTGLNAGSYSFEAKDNKGCLASGTVTITEPTLLTLNHSSKDDILCNGGSTGKITLVASGGTPAYQYQLGTGLFGSSATISGITAGNKTFTVKDAKGCTTTHSVVFTEPTAIVINTISVTDIKCNGDKTGSINISASGGISSYQYNINGGSYQLNGNFSSLAAAKHTLGVMDNNGCTVSKDITVTEPAKLAITTSSVTQVDCKGNATGVITFVASGGTSPYEYSLGGTIFSTTTTTYSGLTAGTYIGYVRDFNGCVSSITVNITEPAILELTIGSQTNVGCNGFSTGSVSLNVSGGTATYSYQMNGGAPQPSSVFSSLAANNYTFKVTDKNGCTDDVTAVITEPTLLNLTTSLTKDIECFGTNTGRVVLSASGGTPSYTYKVGTGTYAASNDFSSLLAGAQTFTVKDANGCTTSIPVTLTQPPALTLTSSSITPVDCKGAKTGAVTVSASGGVAPYSYRIGTDPFQPSGVFSDLPAGTHKFTAKDANDCTKELDVIVTEPSALTITITSIDSVNCFKGNDGSITATVSGGTSGYTYLWDDPANQTTAKASNLEKGTYTVSVTDKNGCKKSETATVNEPAKVSLTVTNVDSVNCFKGADGSISTSISGGSKGYKYLWNDPLKQTTAKATGLKKGTYKLIATDIYGCSDSIVEEVKEPEKVTLTVDAIDSVNCFKGSDGSITTSITGGSKGYKYLWNDPLEQKTSNAIGLKKGTYKLIATDIYGCSDSIIETVNEPEKVTLSVVSIDSVNCFEGSDGSIVTSITGGSKGYKYQWNDPLNQTTSKATKLKAGTYKLIVRDLYGCSDSITRTVHEPAKVSISVSAVDSVNCFGGADGSISTSVNGGSNGYKYLWNDPLGQTTADATNLSKGSYKLIVTDIYNCSDSVVVKVEEPNQLKLSLVTKEDISCFGKEDGKITVSTAGGTPTYKYSWSHAPALNSTSTTIKYKGNFKVYVSDYYNCKDSLAVSISEPDILKLVLDSTFNPRCFRSADGYLGVSTTGGNGGNLYKWNTTPIRYGAAISGLKSGWYKVEVNDSKGCSDTASYRLIAPDSLDASLIVDSVLCFGGNTGRILVMPKGGTPGYAYKWSKYPTNNTALQENLVIGAYDVEITDKNGCKQTLKTTVYQPSKLTISKKANAVSCFGGNDGSIAVKGLGGQRPYDYRWESKPGLSDSTLTGLKAEVYRVYLTDRNGCNLTDTITINQPTKLEVTHSIKQPTCFGSKNGEISITTNGGVKAYTYLWNVVSFGNVSLVKNLGAAKYSVLVTDKNGCRVSQEINIKEKDSLDVEISLQQPKCNGDKNGEISLIVSNNQGPVKCQWTSLGGLISPKIINLGIGKYPVIITDSMGCKTNRTIDLQEPKKLGFTFTKADLKCKGTENGKVQLTGTGGVAPYTYNLGSVSNVTGAFNDLAEGSYLFGVEDVFGCKFTNTLNITSPDSVKINTLSTVDNLCFGQTQGKIIIANSGGVPPYTILWNTGETNDTITGLKAADYSVVVSDKNACLVNKTIRINQPDVLLASATVLNEPICNENQSGSVALSVSGGTSPYLYFSNRGFAMDPEFNNLDSGKFVYTIEDINGCTYTDSLQLNYQRVISATIPKPLVFQTNRFRMIMPVLNGIDSSTATYQWSEPEDFDNQQHEQRPIVRFNKKRTVYLAVTDDKGCLATDSAEILLLSDYGKALPNSFTPNDDGINDEFKFPNYLGVQEFKVFDKFGKILFEHTGDNPKWNGYYKNEMLPQGNYVYYVKFTLPGSSELITVKGTITLLK